MRCLFHLPLAFASIVGASCSKPVAPPQTPSLAPVTVTKAGIKNVPVQLKAIGNVRVLNTVVVRPRVNGELTAVHFKEGEFVKTGDKLFTIDPRPYQTSLAFAQAQLDRDLALLKGAEIILSRSRQVPGTAAITADELDKLRTDVASAAATVTADRAALRTAELQLSYTTIHSPIDGRTGNILIQPGNLLTASQVDPLVVINQITPISVAFAVPEYNLATLDENLRLQSGKLPVVAIPRDSAIQIPGVMSFVDNSVDIQTGTVQLKATFPNDDRRLWPGRFVDIIVTLTERANSVTVPAVAVQEGQNGPFVFVIGAEDKAEQRQIKVAFISDLGEAVIETGLAEGETVVTDGHLRVSPGGKVAIKPAAGEKK